MPKGETEMMSFTDAELDMLTADGYTPGYMMDVREGDLVAIPPVMRLDDKKVQTIVITRLMMVDGSYWDDRQGGIVPHRVIDFIGTDLDGRPHHMSYGNTYPCFIKRDD